ncbi:hypothetical protein AB1Y20_006527 [Prymnesium parvum]|uniref:SET domain-containing protein n=1 Tax=Prymnesium parvum TaxID=97485 RepID=A0AB34IYC4_PRYPA
MASASFHALCEAEALVCAASLFTPPGGERGLVVGTRVPKGEPLLAVPWELVLRADASDVQSAADVLPHHLAVASELLRLTSASSDAGLSRRERLWRAWSLQLPRPHDLTHPAALSAEALRAAHDDALLRAMASRRERVAALLAEPARPLGEAWAHWAYAMVSSRPFLFARPSAAPHARAQFAFVPFIDMTNHASEPNCEVRGVEADGGEGYQAVELVALRDLRPGEAATISYDVEELSSRDLYSTFGFVTDESHRNDRLPTPPKTLTPLNSTALNSTTHRLLHLGASPAFIGAVRASLSSTSHTEAGRGWSCEAEAAAASAHFDWLKAEFPQELATHSIDDDAALHELEAMGRASTATYSMLRYRIGRRRLWEVALQVLQEHIESHNDCSNEAGRLGSHLRAYLPYLAVLFAFAAGVSHLRSVEREGRKASMKRKMQARIKK